MGRSTTASACFNNLLCKWDEMLPSLESTTSWHMIQTSRISKNRRCLWNSEKLKSNLDWSPKLETIMSPLFWKWRYLEGAVLVWRAEALQNPLLQTLAFEGSMEWTLLSVKVSQRSVKPKTAGLLLLRRATSYGKAYHEHKTSPISRREIVGLFRLCYLI